MKGKKFFFKPLRIFNDIEIVVLTFPIIRIKFPQFPLLFSTSFIYRSPLRLFRIIDRNLIFSSTIHNPQSSTKTSLFPPVAIQLQTLRNSLKRKPPVAGTKPLSFGFEQHRERSARRKFVTFNEAQPSRLSFSIDHSNPGECVADTPQ